MASSGEFDRGLFEKFLVVVNRAGMLAGTPRARRTVAEQPCIAIDVVDSVGYARVWVAFHRNHIRVADAPEPSAEPSPGRAFVIHREHIEDVVARPSRYLADPSLLQLPPWLG